ncbi:hypothetical protein LSH36_37g01021 [Paralvinella palmiformis]|uniref:Uncharacterized protein n=1 Tax=Paralvinella palmiformis TaxID=53620 RepID=A0AAD9K892_9ANNE|nr:hypothetical protein LSH36_37g01021 [Paralvinella palmiformis]
MFDHTAADPVTERNPEVREMTHLVIPYPYRAASRPYTPGKPPRNTLRVKKMGRAEGHGEGEGHCSGSDGGNVAAGAGLAVCSIASFCTCGIPMLIAGIILILINYQPTVGIALLCVSVGLTLLAFVLIILICTGVLKKKRTAPGSNMAPYPPQLPLYNEHVNPPPYAPHQNEPIQSVTGQNDSVYNRPDPAKY